MEKDIVPSQVASFDNNIEDWRLVLAILGGISLLAILLGGTVVFIIWGRQKAKARYVVPGHKSWSGANPS